MNIACKDIAIANIRQAIGAQQNQMLAKYKLLKKASSDNKMLIGVVDDYARYLKYIKKQKQEQHDGLKKLAEYIDRLSKTTDTTEELLGQTRQQNRSYFNHYITAE